MCGRGGGVFNVPHSCHEQGLWDGACSLSSLREKTRKSNYLQMSFQRPPFLVSDLKTLCIGHPGLKPMTSRMRWSGALPTEPSCRRLNLNKSSNSIGPYNTDLLFPRARVHCFLPISEPILSRRFNLLPLRDAYFPNSLAITWLTITCPGTAVNLFFLIFTSTTLSSYWIAWKKIFQKRSKRKIVHKKT